MYVIYRYGWLHGFVVTLGFFSVCVSELEYEKAVIPTAISIYETYHPGSVVRVLACNANAGTKDAPGKVK